MYLRDGIFTSAGGFATDNKTIGRDNTEGIAAFGGGNTVVDNGDIASAPRRWTRVQRRLRRLVPTVANRHQQRQHLRRRPRHRHRHRPGNVITNNRTVMVTGPNAVSIGNSAVFRPTTTRSSTTARWTARSISPAQATAPPTRLITLTDPAPRSALTHVIGGDFAQTNGYPVLAFHPSTSGSDALTVSGTATVGGTLVCGAARGTAAQQPSYLSIVTSERSDQGAVDGGDNLALKHFLAAKPVYHPLGKIRQHEEHIAFR